MPEVVGALEGIDLPGELTGYAGPVWLVNGGRDPFRADEARFLAACHDGRLQVWPGRNHRSCLGETLRLTRMVQDACAVTDAAPHRDGSMTR